MREVSFSLLRWSRVTILDTYAVFEANRHREGPARTYMWPLLRKGLTPRSTLLRISLGRILSWWIVTDTGPGEILVRTGMGDRLWRLPGSQVV